MASRKRINISGHYVVSINIMPLHILRMYFEFLKIELSDRIIF